MMEKCEICGRTGFDVSQIEGGYPLCNDCYNETKDDDKHMEREQREES